MKYLRKLQKDRWISIYIPVLVITIGTMLIGFLGQYLDRTYMEVKNRPAYLLKETSESEVSNEEIEEEQEEALERQLQYSIRNSEADIHVKNVLHAYNWM